MMVTNNVNHVSNPKHNIIHIQDFYWLTQNNLGSINELDIMFTYQIASD